MDQEARFLISASMTSKLHKGYRTYPVRTVCNEFTMKGNVRRYGRFPEENKAFGYAAGAGPAGASRCFSQLFCHEHGAIQAITHGFQPGREHRTQSGRSKLAEWSSLGVGTHLLKLEDIGQGDDF